MSRLRNPESRRNFFAAAAGLLAGATAGVAGDATELSTLLARTLEARRERERLQPLYDALNAAHKVAGWEGGPERDAVWELEQGALSEADDADLRASKALVEAVAARGARAAIGGGYLVVDVRGVDTLPHFNDMALVIPAGEVLGLEGRGGRP